MPIATQPFGRSGHMSTRTLFGAASLSQVTQEVADHVLEVLLQYGRGPALPTPTDNGARNRPATHDAASNETLKCT